MSWWWLSFADPGRPKGTQFLGVVLIEGGDFINAISRAHALGINPGGEVQAHEFPERMLPPAEFRDCLMSRERCEECDEWIIKHRAN